MSDINHIREYLISDLKVFYKWVFKNHTGSSLPDYPHFDLIVNKLNDVLDGKTKRLIINIPPRYFKTWLAVKLFVPYCLALNPKAKFIHLSYSDRLALDNSKAIRDIITSDWFQDVFPITLELDTKSKKQWNTSLQGGLYATSSGGQVTGFGAGTNGSEFGGAIMIDDPNKPDDANSEQVRESINYQFDSTIKNRVNNRDTPIIVIQQRVHPRDLSGYLLDNSEGWELLNIPVLDENDNPLCEQIHNLQEIKQMQRENKDVFDTQYMQNPKQRSGSMYESLKYFNPDEVDLKEATYFSFTDSANGGTDYLCCFIVALLDSKLYIVDAVYSKKSSSYTFPLLESIFKRYKTSLNYFELNSFGSMFAQHFKSKGFQVKGHHQSKNKLDRIIASVYYVSFVYFSKTSSIDYNKALKDIESFPMDGKSKNDDAPDCLELIITYFTNKYIHIFK